MAVILERHTGTARHVCPRSTIYGWVNAGSFVLEYGDGPPGRVPCETLQ